MKEKTTLTAAEADFVKVHEYYHKMFSHIFRLRTAETKDPLQTPRSPLTPPLTTPLTPPLPLHPDYGLADTTRSEILRHAAETTVRAAAEKHNVAESTIYRWRALLAEG